MDKNRPYCLALLKQIIVLVFHPILKKRFLKKLLGPIANTHDPKSMGCELHEYLMEVNKTKIRAWEIPTFHVCVWIKLHRLNSFIHIICVFKIHFKELIHSHFFLEKHKIFLHTGMYSISLAQG